MVYNVTKVYVLNNQVLYVDEGAISRDSANYNLIEVITNVSGFGVEIAFELPNGVFSNRLGLTQQTATRFVPSDIAQLSSVSGEEWSVYSALIPNAVLSAITSTTSQTLGFSLRFTQGISNVFYYDSLNDFPTIGEGDKVYAFDDNGSDVFYVWRDNDYTTTDAEDFIVTYNQVYTTEKDVISVQGTIGGEAVALDPAWYQNKIVQDLNKLISDLNAINALINDGSTGLAAKVNKSGDTMTGILTMLNDIAMSDNDITDMGNINSYTFEDGSLDTDAIKLDMLNQLFNLNPPVTSIGAFSNWKEAFASAIQDKFDAYQTIQDFNTNYYTKTQTDNLLDDKVDVTDYDNKVDEIEGKLLAIEGAYVFRGKLTTSTTEEVEADKTLLTTFISDEFEGRQPTLGDVVKDSDGGEWYFDGSDWRFMGQDYIDLDNYYTKTDSDNRYYTETEVDNLLDDKADDTDLTTHINDTDNPHNVTATQVGAEPTFTKNTAFNKDFGTTAGTVAEGNHVVDTDNPHSVTVTQIGAIPSSEKAQANGVATLDGSGKIPINQIPLQFNDVEQYADLNSFPATGEDGKLYIDISTNSLYRWDGTQYVAVIEVTDIVNLEEIPNVNDTGLADNYILKYDSATSKWVVVDHTLGELNDVNTTPTDQQVLYWNNTAGEWQSKSLSKTDVGLSNVENYGIASQVEAEAGILNDKYMTPLRTKQAIDEHLLDDETTLHTQNESIASLPVGTIDGQVSGFEAEGLTLENALENGNFIDNTDWGTLFGSATFSNGNVFVTGNGSNEQLALRRTLNLPINTTDTFFVYSKVRTDTTALTINNSRFGNQGNVIPSPNVNQFYELYSKEISSQTEFRIAVNYADETTQNGAVLEVDFVMLINMTALGIESYTEEQMLNLVRQGYFEGLTSVEQPSITSVGKNLFDGVFTSETQGLVYTKISDTQFTISKTNDDGLGTVNLFPNIKYLPLTQYTFSGSHFETDSVDANMRFVIHYTDGTNTKFSGPNTTNTAFSITSTTEKTISYISWVYSVLGGLTTYTDFQLEQGDTATAYEPYKSSTLALDTTLRSLPNGVRDRVYEQNGEVWLEKRIEEYVLQGSDFDKYTTNLTNVDLVGISQDLKIPNMIQLQDQIQGVLFIGNFYPEIADGTFNDISKIGSFFTTNASDIWIVFAKGTYADLAAAQADLAGTIVQYQLATPQLINLTQQGLADGQLTSYANGTVYNTSDTFHADINFDVASNRSAQITNLISNSDYQTKLIDSKASKVQEDWIEPTLLNGWTNFGGGYSPISFMKDEFGFVHFRGLAKTGTSATQIFQLPVGYRPPFRIALKTYDTLTAGSSATLDIRADGQFRHVNGGVGELSLENISFKVGE